MLTRKFTNMSMQCSADASISMIACKLDTGEEKITYIFGFSIEKYIYQTYRTLC